MPDLHELVAAYAVDALEPAELAEFESHLEGCAECRTELAAMRAATAELAARASVDPPVELRAAVLDAVRTTAQDVPAVGEAETADRTIVEPARWRHARLQSWAVRLGAAAAVVLVVAIGVQLLGDGGLTRDDIAAAPDVVAIQLEGNALEAEFVYSDSLDAGVFTAAELPTVRATQTYQLWLIDDAGARSAGTFRPSAEGTADVVVEAPITPGQLLGLTIEPIGGSSTPTGEVLFAEPLT